MRSLLCAVIFLTFVGGPAAHAVIDPDANHIGVYFDLDANENVMRGQVSVPFFAYVVVTRPSLDEISGVAFSYRLEVPDGLEGLLFRFASQGGPGDDSCISDCDTTDIFEDFHVMNFASPLVGAESVPVLQWQLMRLVDLELFFYLGPVDAGEYDGLSPAIWGPSGEVELGVSSGHYEMPVAIVGPWQPIFPISVEVTSFGAVKSLYR